MTSWEKQIDKFLHSHPKERYYPFHIILFIKYIFLETIFSINHIYKQYCFKFFGKQVFNLWRFWFKLVMQNSFLLQLKILLEMNLTIMYIYTVFCLQKEAMPKLISMFILHTLWKMIITSINVGDNYTKVVRVESFCTWYPVFWRLIFVCYYF